MKRFLFIAICLAGFIGAFAGEVAAELEYRDAAEFKIIGLATTASSNPYYRLPDSLEGKVREQLWELARNNAGVAVRFRTDASDIGVRWTVWMNRWMNHMTATGIRGLDLYCLSDSGWRFVNSARPGSTASNKSKLVSGLSAEMREYMLYLPLYDGVDSLEIVVNSGAVIKTAEVESPSTVKPVVWYGTSIVQGGCASRSGMAATNILSRRLDREVINLGFSGNGRLDAEVAEVMASVDAGLYIIDALPNVTVEQLKQNLERFYDILRQSHPDTPILLVENPPFPNMAYDASVREQIEEKNGILYEFYELFCQRGDESIYFLSSAGMLGEDAEGTVDCNHFTDLGFMRCADYMLPVILRLLP